MTLVLRIENFDQLENGGPTSLTVDERGANIGRRASMDWSLPDPSKMISGHHFDITFQDGDYFLTDVSMNGTFVDGQRHRLEGPLKLAGGERLIVGHYIIGVELQGAQGAAAAAPQDDPWGAYGDPSGMAPVAGGGGPGVDSLNDGFIQMQPSGVQRPGQNGGMKTETSLQLPMHTQGPSGLPQTPPGAAPGGSGGGAIQTPTGWGLPLPPQDAAQQDAPAPAGETSEPFVAYVPNLGQDAPDETPGPLPEASRPAPQPIPPAPSETAPADEAPGIDVPYTPSLGQDVTPEPAETAAPAAASEVSAPPYAMPPAAEAPAAPQAGAFSPSFGMPEPAPTPEPHAPEPPAPQPPQMPAPPQAAPSSIPMPRPAPPEPAPSPVPTPQAAPTPQPMPQAAPMPPMPGAMPPSMPEPAAPAPGVPGMAPMGGDVSAALRAFCEGAGLDPKSVKPEDAVGLMHTLGRCVRIATEEQMAMLKARSDVKNFTRGGVRTMLSANANNPMKFMPDSQQALELMFVAPRDGFMTGADSFKDALGDIRTHQEAVFRALQPALAEVFRGLSPEEIEGACEGTGSNLLGGKRSGKQWTTYVERWDEKAQAGEHGILDAFLQAFAKAYAEANARE